jgi:hypothetical protein
MVHSNCLFSIGFLGIVHDRTATTREKKSGSGCETTEMSRRRYKARVPKEGLKIQNTPPCTKNAIKEL